LGVLDHVPKMEVMGRIPIRYVAMTLAGVVSLTPGLWSKTVPLIVPAGAPLHVSIDKKIPIKHVGEAVQGHLVRAVFAFDREVIPAGSRVTGEVVRLDPVSSQKRIRSIMNGDFTPLQNPQIAFNKLYLPDGRVLSIQTVPASGRGVIPQPDTSVHVQPKDNFLGRTQEFLRCGFASAREQAVSTWKSGDKWDRLQATAYSYLPYHPQFIPARTQIAVELREPLSFGSEKINSVHEHTVGLPPADSIVQARMTSPITSNSQPGTRVEAIVSKPLFSEDHQLLLPEGTRLIGTVVSSQPAASWRRGGRLRFSFQWMELPSIASRSNRLYRMDAILSGLDGPGSSMIKVDSEGGSRSVEPITRFIAPALKLLIGSQLVDNDQQIGGQSQTTKRTWSTLAGASGFGVVGSVASQISHEAGTGLGFYGLGWSVFTHIVAKGHTVIFSQDTPIQIRLMTSPG
jgi:hypothetical protein